MAGKAFRDTSAVLPLLVSQTTSARARTLAKPCNERPRDRSFVSFDNPLADAAEAEGFKTLRIRTRRD